MKRVNTFVAMGSKEQESKEKKAEGSEETAKGSRKKMLGRKREGKHQQQESSKKQRIEEDKESDEVEEVSEDDEGELLKHLVIKKDEDIAIDAIPLATKLPVIVDYKLHKEDREDLEVLWRIVKAKYSDTRPKDEFERVLWGDLKVMFEPDSTSDVWRMLQGYRVTIWKLIDSSGVYFVRNLKIQKLNIKFRGGLLRLERLQGHLRILMHSVERAITTDASLDASQDSDNIIRTQTMSMPNVNIPQGMDTGGSPRRQETMGVLLLRLDNVPPTPHDSPLSGGYTPEVESSDDLDEEDASKQGRNDDKTKPMFKDSDFDVLDDAIEDVDGGDAEQITTTRPSHVSTAGQVSTARPEVSAFTPYTPPTTTVFDDEDVTMAMAQTLIKMKEEKAKEKGVVIKNIEDLSRPVKLITTLQSHLKIDPKDKGKSVLVEEEPKKVKIRDQGLAQIESDAELAQRLHEEELAYLMKFKPELMLMPCLLQISNKKREREQFTIEERAQFLVETIATQRKFRAAQRAIEIRRKTHEEVHGLYERQQKRDQDFIPVDSEKEAQKSGKRLKRVTGSYTTQKSPKKPKVIKSTKDVTE
ncbi:hypothetical protein Tco_0588365 [Tanacetum coccineum]